MCAKKLGLSNCDQCIIWHISILYSVVTVLKNILQIDLFDSLTQQNLNKIINI